MYDEEKEMEIITQLRKDITTLCKDYLNTSKSPFTVQNVIFSLMMVVEIIDNIIDEKEDKPGLLQDLFEVADDELTGDQFEKMDMSKDARN